MTKFYSLLATAAIAVTAGFSAFAQEGTPVLSPEAGKTYSEFPNPFTVTFEGATKVEKTWNGNPIKVTNPAGKAQQVPMKSAEGNVATFDIPASFDLTAEGEYKIELLTNKLKLTFEDETTANNSIAQTWTYTVGAAAEETGVTISIDPKETLETFPNPFTLTFNGAVSLKSAGILAGNPVKITDPDGVVTQCAATYKENVATFKAGNTLDPTKKGEYKVDLLAEKISITWPDETVTKNEAQSWTFTVEGTGGEDEDDTVKYDLEISGYQPKLSPFDIVNKTLDGLQMTINAGDVRPVENATVTIEGPGYNASAALKFNMGTPGGTTTSLIAKFPDPKYNGKYTLTIAKESFGTPAWIEDHEKGRTNADIKYEFEVVGGKDYVSTGVEATLGIVYTPGMGSKVETFDKVTLTFAEKVYYDEEATVNAGVMRDFSATAYTNYGTATFTRISDTELEAVFENGITGKGQYKLTIPEGFFWNEEHENNPEAGKVNSEQEPYWTYFPPTPKVEVTSTTPAEGAKISHFPAGYEVIIDTDNNEAVAYMTITLTQYENDNDMASPKTLINDAKSTEKTADGAICWKNGEDMMIFSTKYYYELEYALFNEDDAELASGIITFDGDDYVGINEISANGEETIFTVQGIRVNRKGSELPAGLYIINGKKVIRK